MRRLVLIFGLILTGCSSGMQRPQKGGMATIQPTPAGPAVSITQPENPAASSSQEREVSDEATITLPAGSEVTQRQTDVSSDGKTNVSELVVTVSEPTPLRKVRTESTRQNIGAAQKDTAREVAAKLASMKPVQFVGILFVVAAVAMFHPVVRALVGSTTVQVVTGVTGFALIALPTILVGNEKLILLFAAPVPFAWWIIHRNASKSTEVRILREWIDKDGDGRDDVTGKRRGE